MEKPGGDCPLWGVHAPSGLRELCPLCQGGFLGLVLRQASLGSTVSVRQYTRPPGDVIYRRNESGQSVYSICKGAVKLERTLPDGRSRVVRVLQAGALLGLELLADRVHHHTAVCVGRTQLCEVPVAVLERCALAEPGVHAALMQQWQVICDECDVVITEFLTGPARVRLARLVLHLARAHPTHTCQSMSREDMASLLDLTPETVSRTMATFKREGLVAEHAGVLACQLAGLEAISAGRLP